MMTPRGVADVHVYTPERVELRYGVRPDQVPDFIGLKGDTSDNIPGVPGIGDKTAGQLIAQYGSLEEVIEHADELSPARKKNITRARRPGARVEGARDDAPRPRARLRSVAGSCWSRPTARSCARSSGGSSSAACSTGSTSSRRRSPPPRPSRVVGTAVPWREGELPHGARRVGLAIADGRFALAQEEGVIVGAWDESLMPRLRDAQLVAHDFKALPRLTMQPADDTLIAAYLIEPGRSEYLIDDLSAEYGLEVVPEPAVEEETAALIRRAEAPRRLAAPMRERLVERGSEHLYDEIELPLTAVLAAMEDAGVKIDTYRMGEITARLADRVEELEARAIELAGEEFMLGSTQQVARILFEKLELTPGRKGKTGYSTDTRVLRSIRDEHEIVGVLEEWRELSKLINTYLGPLPQLISEKDGRLHTTFNQAVASTGRLSTTNPNLQAIPIRTELGREIRSAFVAEPGLPADLGRLQPGRAAHPRARLRRAGAARGVRAQRGHPRAHGRRGARQGPGDADEGRAQRRQDGQLRDHLRHLGVRALREPRDPARAGAGVHRHLPRALPARAGLHRAHDRAGRAGRLRDDAARPAAAGAGDPGPNRQTRALGERLAVNSVMQGTAADMIKVAMIRIHHRLRDEGRAARLVLQVHDELLLEAPETETSAVKELVREEMCAAYPLDPPLAVDVGVGDDWNSQVVARPDWSGPERPVTLPAAGAAPGEKPSGENRGGSARAYSFVPARLESRSSARADRRRRSGVRRQHGPVDSVHAELDEHRPDHRE